MDEHLKSTTLEWIQFIKLYLLIDTRPTGTLSHIRITSFLLDCLYLRYLDLSNNVAFCFFLWAIGGGHPRNTGPPPGGEEHHWDAGHHSSGSSAGGGSLCDGCVRAVWSHSAATAGAFQQHPTPLHQQGQKTFRRLGFRDIWWVAKG